MVGSAADALLDKGPELSNGPLIGPPTGILPRSRTARVYGPSRTRMPRWQISTPRHLAHNRRRAAPKGSSTQSSCLTKFVLLLGNIKSSRSYYEALLGRKRLGAMKVNLALFTVCRLLWLCYYINLAGKEKGPSFDWVGLAPRVCFPISPLEHPLCSEWPPGAPLSRP